MKTILIKRYTSNRGSALFIALVMILLFASMSAAYMTLSQSNYRNTQSRLNSIQSYYVAESGIEHALVELSARGSMAQKYIDGADAVTGAIGGDRYSVDAKWIDADTVHLMSSGESNGFTRRIEAVARREIPPIFEYAIVTENNLDFRGSIAVKNGDVHSNKNIVIKGGAAKLDGDVSAVGTIEGKTGGVSGDVLPGSVYVPIETVSLESLKKEAIGDGTYYSGDQTWAGGGVKGKKPGGGSGIGDKVDGVIYVDGNLHLSGNIEGTGFIVVSGKVDISGNVTYGTKDSSVIIISDGDVFIRGNPDVTGTIYTNGSVALKGNVDVTGSIIASNGFVTEGDSTLRGNVDLVYVKPDDSLTQRFARYEIAVRREIK